MFKRVCKIGLMVGLLLWLMSTSKPAQAQWPPFWYNLTPTYENGQIRYEIEFFKRVKWAMIDLTFRIPLPDGTQFVETKTQGAVEAGFDGQEIFFETSSADAFMRGNSFVVEVTAPHLTVFTTHTWIAWKGEVPGSFLSDDVSIDITKQPLNWENPNMPNLRMELTAKSEGDRVTYFVRPVNAHTLWGIRMQDVKISIPLPVGTTFLAADAPLPFVADFNGQEISFSALELERWQRYAPLTIEVSTASVETPFVVAYAWATWKNAGPRVLQRLPAEEQIRSGDVIVQTGSSQWVVSDIAGDVPMADYDLISVAIQQEGSNLKITFFTAANLGSEPSPLRFRLNVDSDCQIDTGVRERGRGVEYWINYLHDRGTANLLAYNDDTKQWDWVSQLRSLEEENQVSVWAPSARLTHEGQLCWFAESQNRTDVFYPSPPLDYLPNWDSSVAQNEVLENPSVDSAIDLSSDTISPRLAEDTPSREVLIDVGAIWHYMPGWTEPSPSWPSPNFDDSAWFSGPTGIGYGEGNYVTDLALVTQPPSADAKLTLIQQVDPKSGMTLAVLPTGDGKPIYMRHEFSIPEALEPKRLLLEADYSGGIIVYLNGYEVARRGMGQTETSVSHNILANDQETPMFEVIDLSDQLDLLSSESNVLAIQAHRSVHSDSLYVTPKLIWENN